MLFLDWEKAFDRIDHERLLEALERLHIPPTLLKLISLIYKTPKFRVVTGASISEYREQRSGIRQGCPLSPYLFVLVMTVMFDDIKDQHLNKPLKGHFDSSSSSDVIIASNISFNFS